MKERLTGAIILVVLIVLLVPELLSGPKGSSAPATPAASAEEPPLRSYTINLGEDSHSQAEAAGAGGPAMPQQNGPEQPTAQASPPAPQVATTAPPVSQPMPPAPKPAASGTKTSAAAPKTSASATKPSPAVPASPRSSRASKAPHPAAPHLAAPNPAVPSPAVPTGSGWAVQLGVFGSRENAERLAMEVRVKGFKASVSPFTSGGRKLYRVRVGPTADRTAAQELQGRLKASGRPGGTVVPYS